MERLGQLCTPQRIQALEPQAVDYSRNHKYTVLLHGEGGTLRQLLPWEYSVGAVPQGPAETAF